MGENICVILENITLYLFQKNTFLGNWGYVFGSKLT